eukprot:scaffold447_cov307-Pinguiococcus_pyrenoidosus.AAC.60
MLKVVTIRAMEGIERASVLDISKETTFSQPFQYAVQTEGSNILKMLGSFSDVLDYDELECNDIAKISEIYGIEACRAAISKEITNVFGVYGISVDPRHLSLISDAMTFTGEYTPMNRRGISKSSSPYLQMSFETTTHFLLDAAMNGVKVCGASRSSGSPGERACTSPLFCIFVAPGQPRIAFWGACAGSRPEAGDWHDGSDAAVAEADVRCSPRRSYF